MPEPKLRVLLLSVGTLGAQSVIDALGPRRERCVLIGTNSLAEAAGNFRCDIAYLVPPAATGAEHIDCLAALIEKEHPDLVVPTRDDDVLALARLKERSPRGHPVLLTGSAAAARTWHDKVETARFARRHGLPFAATAETVREALELAKTYRLPLIGKPRCGNGSRGVVLLRSTGEIERAFESSPDLIAQPFLDPPPNMEALIAPCEAGMPFIFSFPESGQYGVEIIVGPDGALAEPFGTLTTLIGGQAIQVKRLDDPELEQIGRAYAAAGAAEGWRGPVNEQLKRTPGGRLVAHEVNGRFTGGTGPRTHIGCDEIAEVVRRFLPQFGFPSIEPAATDLVQQFLTRYAVPGEGVAALRALGRWSRADDA